MSGKTMRCITFAAPGPPDVLTMSEAPVPQPGAGELLVRVAACGVNGADLNLRAGRSKAADATGRPGLEVFGTVAEVGPDCGPELSPSGTRWQVGDALCALVPGGGYAEYVVVPVEQCLPPPQGLDAAAAAGVIETAATVWDNVFVRGRLAPGDVLLVHGGASGIGSTAIQLANLYGARVFATAGSDEKCRLTAELGAEVCFNYKRDDFVAGVVERAGGADVILDVAGGGGYLSRNLQALKLEGRIVVIAANAGTQEPLDFWQSMTRRASVMGSTLKNRSKDEKRAILCALWREVWPRYAAGRARVIVGRVFPLAEAAQAHAYMESGEAWGKTILTP